MPGPSLCVMYLRKAGKSTTAEYWLSLHCLLLLFVSMSAAPLAKDTIRDKCWGGVGRWTDGSSPPLGTAGQSGARIGRGIAVQQVLAPA